jgi:hypothetical protein
MGSESRRDENPKLSCGWPPLSFLEHNSDLQNSAVISVCFARPHAPNDLASRLPYSLGNKLQFRVNPELGTAAPHLTAHGQE